MSRGSGNPATPNQLEAAFCYGVTFRPAQDQAGAARILTQLRDGSFPVSPSQREIAAQLGARLGETMHRTAASIRASLPRAGEQAIQELRMGVGQRVAFRGRDYLIVEIAQGQLLLAPESNPSRRAAFKINAVVWNYYAS